jgi:hypothetical protein
MMNTASAVSGGSHGTTLPVIAVGLVPQNGGSSEGSERGSEGIKNIQAASTTTGSAAGGHVVAGPNLEATMAEIQDAIAATGRKEDDDYDEDMEKDDAKEEDSDDTAHT